MQGSGASYPRVVRDPPMAAAVLHERRAARARYFAVGHQHLAAIATRTDRRGAVGNGGAVSIGVPPTRRIEQLVSIADFDHVGILDVALLPPVDRIEHGHRLAREFEAIGAQPHGPDARLRCAVGESIAGLVVEVHRAVVVDEHRRIDGFELVPDRADERAAPLVEIGPDSGRREGSTDAELTRADPHRGVVEDEVVADRRRPKAPTTDRTWPTSRATTARRPSRSSWSDRSTSSPAR